MRNNKIDLHVHSAFSDGVYSPKDILKKANYIGLKAVAVTDHDTIDGLREFLELSKNFSVLPVLGIEFSVSDYNGIRDIDMLGYFPDINLLNPIREVCEKIRTAREKRLESMIGIFQKENIKIRKKDVLCGNGPLFSAGRKHLAEAVYKNNPRSFDSIQEVFDKYLGSGCKADVPISYNLNIPDAVELIHGCSGKAFLAHPGVSNGPSLDKNKGRVLIQYALDCGADGAEGYYLYYKNRPYKGSKMTIEENMMLCEEYISLIKKNGKGFTAGSDSHGNNGIEIGENPGTAEILEYLF